MYIHVGSTKITLIILIKFHIYIYKKQKYIQINTWAFPYWPGYHPETLILARDGMPMY